jgi:hypothetical protein
MERRLTALHWRSPLQKAKVQHVNYERQATAPQRERLQLRLHPNKKVNMSRHAVDGDQSLLLVMKKQAKFLVRSATGTL